MNMKIVNYFGYDVEVPITVNYLAFELVNRGNKSLGYELYGYITQPTWSKDTKLWYATSSVGLIEQCDIQEILQKIRTNGIKPSKSLVYCSSKVINHD